MADSLLDELSELERAKRDKHEAFDALERQLNRALEAFDLGEKRDGHRERD